MKNKHAKRRVPSSLRTAGRIARSIWRRTKSPAVTQATFEHVQARMIAAHALFDRRSNESQGQGFEDAGRDLWKAEGGAA